MIKRPTIHDVAQKAGVTATTVSRVINNYHYVSIETRALVLQTIKDMGYRPRLSARHLRTQATRLFGVLTDQITTSPYGFNMVRGAQDEAWKNKQVMMVFNVGDKKARMEEAIEELIEREVEGVIYASMIYKEVELPQSLNKIPTVLTNCYEKRTRFMTFLVDEVRGGYDATKILIEKGHQRIAFLNLTSDPKRRSSAERLIGYRKALEEHGIAFDKKLLHYLEHKPLAGYQHTLKIMQLEKPPTAIFCGNDRTALECFSALKELGIKIPDDVSIVGYDNHLDISEHLHPTLTTVELPHYQIGREAMRCLTSHSSDGDVVSEPATVLVNCPLVFRNSVKDLHVTTG